jgi:hypothetical protein
VSSEGFRFVASNLDVQVLRFSGERFQYHSSREPCAFFASDFSKILVIFCCYLRVPWLFLGVSSVRVNPHRRPGEGPFGWVLARANLVVTVLKSFSLVATYGIDIFPLRILYK